MVTGKVSVGVTKEWIGVAKGSAQVSLLAYGKKFQMQTLNEGNDWQDTFRDLEKYDNGKEIVYTVEEEKIPGYRTEITGNMSKGFTVKNISNTVKDPTDKDGRNSVKTGDENHAGGWGIMQ